jgi:hypothetical protein
VVARFKGHDRGAAFGSTCATGCGGELLECIDLGVIGAGTAVPAFGEDFSTRSQNNSADPRVRAKCRPVLSKLKRTTHRRFELLWCGCHILGSFRSQNAPRGSQRRAPKMTPKGIAPLFFSHPDFNRRFWSFTRSTEIAFLPLRVADYNRRLRFSLTPKNVFVAGLSSQKTAKAAWVFPVSEGFRV